MAGTSNSGRIGSSKRKSTSNPGPEANFTVRIPQYLNTNVHAKRFWHRTREELKDVLTDKDGFALEVAAGLYMEMINLQETLNSKGHTMIVKSDRGAENEKPRPEVSLLKTARTEFKNMLCQFGLTPKSGRTMKLSGGKRKQAGSSIRDKYKGNGDD